MINDYFHVLNPNAHRREATRSFFRANPKLRTMWVERKSHPAHLETILNWALVEGVPNIALWGGDGTLNRALQFLHERNALQQVKLMLIPAGTCNDFYRKIVETIPVGAGAFFDLGMLETENAQRIFLNNAGFGRTRKATTAKSNALVDIWNLTPKKIDLVWQEEGRTKSIVKKVLMGVVCNSPYFHGGLHFEKNGNPTDGLLDGFFEEPHSRAALIWKFMMSHGGRALSDRHTFTIRSPKIRVSSDPVVYPQVDGEPVSDDGVREMTFSVLKQAVQIIVGEKFV